MNWNEVILNKITNSILDVSIVIDKDKILNNESILLDINKDNYEVLEMSDLEEVRISIEKKKTYKNGKKLLIISNKYKKSEIPYDFTRDWDVIELNLNNLFERLNYHVLKNIDSSLYSDLYNESLKSNSSKCLGENSTIKFILKKIYNIDLNDIDTHNYLISKLIDIYINNKEIDRYISKYLLEQLNTKVVGNLDIEILSDKTLFWNYIQEQWTFYINDRINNTYKSFIDFNYSDIKTKIPYLFYEGYLKPLSIENTYMIEDILKIGLYENDEFDNKKLESLIEKIELLEIKSNIRYYDWLDIAESIASIEYLLYLNKNNIDKDLKDKVYSIIENTEAMFSDWLMSHYGTLYNLNYIKKPIMVHHIPKYISHKRNEKSKVALIVIDGLSLNQWNIIKEYIDKNISDIKIKYNSSFAWIPTITSISRQSIFSGKIPSQFSKSIYTTNKEELYWKLFWEEEGFKSHSIKYKKGLGKGNLNDVEDILKISKVSTVGLVIDIVDKIMHGQQLGNNGMIQSIRSWMDDRYLIELLEVLLSYGYNIYLTSDHGNIEAKGIGVPKQGNISETRGQRSRIYSNELLISDIEEKYNSILWPGYGLPEDMKVCIPKKNYAYIKENEQIISHGGISIKEVIVPFIEIWKDEN